MKRLGVLLVFSMLYVCMTGSSSAEMVDNPAYKNWKNFQPNAFVKYRSVTTVAGQQTVIEMKQKLLEVKPEKVVVEIETKFISTEYTIPPSTANQDIPAQVDSATLPENNPAYQYTVLEESTENVDVTGATVSAKKVKSKIVIQGMTTTSETWESESIPGGMAKMSSTTDMGSSNTTSEMSILEYSAN